jgi:hypothetical protein
MTRILPVRLLGALLLVTAVGLGVLGPATVAAQEEEGEAGEEEVVDDAQDGGEGDLEEDAGVTGEGVEPGFDDGADEPLDDGFGGFDEASGAGEVEGGLSPTVMFLASLALIVVVALVIFFQRVSAGRARDGDAQDAR